MEHWRQAAVFYRFMHGDSIKAIAATWGLEERAVEDDVRRYTPDIGGLVTVAPPVGASPTTTRATRTPRRAPKILDELHEATRRPKRAAAAAPPPKARRSRRAPAEGPDWQARARAALLGRPVAASVAELVTVLRFPDAERKVATARLWAALQALVKSGEVQRQGTRYHLVAHDREVA